MSARAIVWGTALVAVVAYPGCAPNERPNGGAHVEAAPPVIDPRVEGVVTTLRAMGLLASTVPSAIEGRGFDASLDVDLPSSADAPLIVRRRDRADAFLALTILDASTCPPRLRMEGARRASSRRAPAPRSRAGRCATVSARAPPPSRLPACPTRATTPGACRLAAPTRTAPTSSCVARTSASPRARIAVPATRRSASTASAPRAARTSVALTAPVEPAARTRPSARRASPATMLPSRASPPAPARVEVRGAARSAREILRTMGSSFARSASFRRRGRGGGGPSRAERGCDHARHARRRDVSGSRHSTHIDIVLRQRTGRVTPNAR